VGEIVQDAVHASLTALRPRLRRILRNFRGAEDLEVTDPDRLLPEQISKAPELLVLVQLDAALWTLAIAIGAAYPELYDELARPNDRADLKAARLLCDRARSLHRAIARYRRALRAQQTPSPDLDDLPF
jgi:hypothetical protein